MKKLIFILLLPLCFQSCSSNDSSSGDIEVIEEDYLIFGHYYGMCGGDSCVVTYKLTDDSLFEDVTKEYWGTDFNFIPMEQDKFETVKDLLAHFPVNLLNEHEDFFGCPDCADQGGLFIEYSKNGIIKNCRLDQTKNNVPSYLHPFMDKVNEKINLLYN